MAATHTPYRAGTASCSQHCMLSQRDGSPPSRPWSALDSPWLGDEGVGRRLAWCRAVWEAEEGGLLGCIPVHRAACFLQQPHDILEAHLLPRCIAAGRPPKCHRVQSTDLVIDAIYIVRVSPLPSTGVLVAIPAANICRVSGLECPSWLSPKKTPSSCRANSRLSAGLQLYGLIWHGISFTERSSWYAPRMLSQPCSFLSLQTAWCCQYAINSAGHRAEHDPAGQAV